MSEAAQKKVQQMIDDNGIGMYPLSPLLLPTRRFNLLGPLVRPIHIIMSRLTRTTSAVVFSKSYCPYCNNAKRILDGYGAKYAHYELNQEDDGADVQDALYKLNGQRTVPNIYIGKVHIGGNSDLEGVVTKGKNGKNIEELLKAAGAIAE